MRSSLHFPLVRWLLRVLTAAALAFCLGWLPYQVYGGAGIGRLKQLRREHAELKAKNQQAAADNERLRAEVHGLRYDLGAIERVAREELGLVKKGEIVFQLEEPR
ncbi:MAG TPA: septum formation initiator family protein [Polyangia bacterium]